MSQLLLMSNIAENYIERIPPDDWLRLLHLAAEKKIYITNIIEADTGPLSEIASTIARASGRRRKEVYDLALALKNK